MKNGLNASNSARIASIASFWLSFLLFAPGLIIGVEGITDGIGPTGFAGLSEMAGFIFGAWSIFRAVRLLVLQFMGAPIERAGCVIAAIVLAGAFWLLMNVIGLEASAEHKRAYTGALQPLGWFALILLIFRVALWTWPRIRTALTVK